MENAITQLNDLDVQIVPCTDTDLKKGQYTKLNLSPYQKAGMSALFQQLPNMATAAVMSNAYIVSFTKGLPHTLMHLKNGQYATPIMGDKGIVGSAGLTSLHMESMLLGAFSVMSVATGQYFLTEINKKFELVNEKIDKIMNFLYGDKKAELISEISFVQYANTNYNTIMAHEEQRAATIVSLQNAKKTAMKDIEFYMSDLDNALLTHPKNSEITSIFQIKESLELSMQLLVVSNIMEVFYSQNFDAEYLSGLKDFVASYITKCEKRILANFSKLNAYLNENKQNIIKNVISKQDTEISEKVEAIINSLNGGNNSPMLDSINLSLNFSEETKSTTYYFDKSGDIYMKKEERVS